LVGGHVAGRDIAPIAGGVNLTQVTAQGEGGILVVGRGGVKIDAAADYRETLVNAGHDATGAIVGQGGNWQATTETTVRGSELRAGQGMIVGAGAFDAAGRLLVKDNPSDLLIRGSSLDGGAGSVNLVADGDIAAVSARNIVTRQVASASSHSTWYGKETNERHYVGQTDTTETRSRVSGQDGVVIVANGDVTLMATTLQGKNVDIAAAGKIDLLAVQNVHQMNREDYKSTSWGLFGIDLYKSKYDGRASEQTTTAVVTQVQSVAEATSTSGGDTTLEGSLIQGHYTPRVGARFDAGKLNRLAAGPADLARLTHLGALDAAGPLADQASLPPALAGASLHLLGVVESDSFSQTEKTTYGQIALYQKIAGQGHVDQTLVLPRFEGGVDFSHVDRLTAQIPAGPLATQVNTLAGQPGMAWLTRLASRPDVDWRPVALAHEQWDYHHQGLTPAGAAAVAIVVAIVTYGAGSAAMGTTVAVEGGTAGGAAASGAAAGSALASTTTLGTVTLSTTTVAGATTYTAAGAVINAGFTTLATQASISLINNQGDIGKTLNDLGGSDSLKGVLASMLTAGVAGSFGNSWGADRLLAQTAAGCVAGELSGGDCGKGAASAAIWASLAWGAHDIRQNMIEDSKKFAGIIGTEDKTVLSNQSGQSVGVNGDGFKLAGGRVDLKEICGVASCRMAPPAPLFGRDSLGLAMKCGRTRSPIRKSSRGFAIARASASRMSAETVSAWMAMGGRSAGEGFI
jgi:hypothetical protein